MIFKQLFEPNTCTYTYLLASDQGHKAMLIDPVKEQSNHYIKLLNDLGLTLVYALDTHTHADHITALGELRDITGCKTIMGKQSRAKCVSRFITDGELITVNNITLKCLYTPGHTDESYSYYLQSGGSAAVFTGDALLINGSGRTDFQNGDARTSYQSIVEKLFMLGDETRVYPGHDYNGNRVSTIGDEKRFNPRLAGKTMDEYVEIMNNLNLPDPKMMDEAIPANLACGNL